MKFLKFFLSIGRIEKLSFFESAIFDFFFASSPSKSVKFSLAARIDQNFDDYSGFQAKTTAA